jgi:23S rRNA pseudouridine2605 synthase
MVVFLMDCSGDQSERLQKAMARLGIASRRHAEILISQGLVKVNGQTITQLGLKVTAEDVIEVNAQTYSSRPSEGLIYVMLYKPVGVITSVTDPHQRKTVIDLLGQNMKERIYPVGRLDYDTSGLLLLTNDGELTFRLTHPSFGVEKVYRASVAGDISDQALRMLESGIHLEDGMTSPAKIKKLSRDKSGNGTEIELTIHEGKNRQVRRMLEQVGYPVVRLRRISFGPLRLDPKMTAGEYRLLTASEVNALKEAVSIR